MSQTVSLVNRNGSDMPAKKILITKLLTLTLLFPCVKLLLRHKLLTQYHNYLDTDGFLVTHQNVTHYAICRFCAQNEPEFCDIKATRNIIDCAHYHI